MPSAVASSISLSESALFPGLSPWSWDSTEEVIISYTESFMLADGYTRERNMVKLTSAVILNGGSPHLFIPLGALLWDR